MYSVKLSIKFYKFTKKEDNSQITLATPHLDNLAFRLAGLDGNRRRHGQHRCIVIDVVQGNDEG